jgi:hypothetical protein
MRWPAEHGKTPVLRIPTAARFEKNPTVLKDRSSILRTEEAEPGSPAISPDALGVAAGEHVVERPDRSMG